jgi:hypothetical protein
VILPRDLLVRRFGIRGVGFREFVADVGRRDARVTVVDRRSEPPVYRLLVGLFDTDAVTVREAESGDDSHPPDSTVLRTGDGSEAVAVSSLGAVRDELLLVNSDIYRTGARDLDDVDPPDVIAGLDGVPFRVRSDVRQPKAKLVLIEMSRAIEAMAWRDGTGRLDAGFQHLSRIADERGTRRVSHSSAPRPTSKRPSTAPPDRARRCRRSPSGPPTPRSSNGRGSWCTGRRSNRTTPPR